VRIPLSWLAELVELPPASGLAEGLTRAGLECALETPPPPPDHVVAGRVISREPHPDADRLSVCRVDAGGGAPVTVVCGAPNVAAGQVGALALPGAVLGEIRVAARKVRGVESAGMLCSERELGLSEDHRGILVLPEGTPPGKPLREVLPRREMLVAEPTSNRGDWMSVLGVAREIAAVFGARLTAPGDGRRAADAGAGPWRIEVEDGADCPRYCARVLEGLEPGASPAWMRERLAACGVRPLLDLVDVTNYVLLELGHPLHAFDVDRFRGTAVRVRRARAGERLVTLDGRERALAEEVLVIADGEQPVALAGLMGGEPTAVGEGTRRVLLEGAAFAAARVRAGSRRLGLVTDASARFERGVDPEGVPAALDRAVALLRSLHPGARLAGAADAYPRPATPRRVELRKRTLRRIVGEELPPADVAGILGRLGMPAESLSDGWAADVPTWRPDVAREEDLVEEVARIHGYDRIPDRVRVHAAAPAGASPRLRAVERARRIALGLGLSEVVTPSLVEAGRERALADPSGFFAEPVPVRNPLSADRDALRGALIPSLVQVLATNRARGASDLAIFEVSRSYAARAGGGVDERTRLAILLSGRGADAERGLGVTPCDFFDMKGLVEVYVEEFWGASLELGDDVPALLLPDASAAVLVDGCRVGFFGEAGRDVRRIWDLPPDLPVFLAELDLAAGERPDEPRLFRALPRHPEASRDLAFVVGRGVRHRDLAGTIAEAGGDLLEACRLFDVYEGSPLAPGERSLAFTLTFRAPDRSLTGEEVDASVARIVDAAGRAHRARLR
jgi:phenylalanyl-tRNA synthetase beta chain